MQTISLENSLSLAITAEQLNRIQNNIHFKTGRSKLKFLSAVDDEKQFFLVIIQSELSSSLKAFHILSRTKIPELSV
jgi:hypothetical protein